MMIRLLILILIQCHIAQAEPLLGFYDSASAPTSTAREEWLSRPVMFSWNAGSIRYYKEGNFSWHLAPIAKWLSQRPGRQMVYTLFIFTQSKPELSTQTLQGCASGAYDADYKKFALALEKYGLTKIILRLGHEFTGNWYSWSSIGKEGAYAGCYRRIVNVLRAAVPSNEWKFDWNPVGRTGPDILAATYPGDSYVDYITTDLYDTAKVNNSYPYPASCDGDCRYMRQRNNWNAAKITLDRYKSFAAARGKPMAITEWGTWSERHVKGVHKGGGDDPFFIVQMHKYIHDPANNIAYSVYFDVDTAEGNHKLCCGDSTEFPKASARFRELFGVSFQVNSVADLPAQVNPGDRVSLKLRISSNTVRPAAEFNLFLLNAQGQIVLKKTVDRYIAVSAQNEIEVPFVVPSAFSQGDYRLALSILESAKGERLYSNTKLTTLKVAPSLRYGIANTGLNLLAVRAGQILKFHTDVMSAETTRLAVTVVVYDDKGKFASKTFYHDAVAGKPIAIDYDLPVATGTRSGNYWMSMSLQRLPGYVTVLYADRITAFAVVP